MKEQLKEQLVVKLDNKFKRLGIGLDPAGWIRRQFKPSEGQPRGNGDEGKNPMMRSSLQTPAIRDTRGKVNSKGEYAQRIAQTFTTTLSRVAVDESEWLRRMAEKGS